MPKASTNQSNMARRKRSSRRGYEDSLIRIHRVRRELEARRKKLGLSERDYLDYIARELHLKGHAV